MTLRRASPGRVIGAIATILATCALSAAARADGHAAAVPAPSWVDPDPRDPQAIDAQVAANHGVVWLLSDNQVRTGDGNGASGKCARPPCASSAPERYTRRAFHVETPKGIETISELHFDYDPTFERLALHFVHIVRGDRVIDALSGADWKVIQPESDRDRRIYSGQLEGLLVLHDVRVGDVIDYAYSIRGDNPVLGGHFVDEIDLDQAAGVADLRRRIVSNTSRPLALKPHGRDAAPVETVEGDVRQYTWHRTHVDPPENEDEVPAWYHPDGWVDVSDFASWNEVASSATSLFAAQASPSPPSPPPSPELSEQVAKWQHNLPNEQERALAATRFVQDEIRYLGIEIGRHTHEPFPAATVLQRRFGDCKDKALLLVTLLRSLSIAADPVLVSTTSVHTLDDQLPSPFVFDHAIVRATLDGQAVFIDPTVSLERGPLVGREPPPYERALVVSKDTQGLIPLGDPRPRIPTYDVDETYTLPPSAGVPTLLDVVTTFRLGDADGMRSKVSSTSLSELGRRYLNYYAKVYPEIVALGEPTVEDNEASDVLVVHEHYELPTFWQGGARELSPAVMDAYLRAPKITRRHMPLRVVFPAHVAEHIHVKTQRGKLEAPGPTDARDDAALFRATAHLEDDTLTLDYEYEALSDAVSAADVPAHLSLLQRIGKAWTYTLKEPTITPRKIAPLPMMPPVAWWTTGGIFAFGLSVWVARGVKGWSRRRALRKRTALEQVAQGAQEQAPTSR